MAKQRSSPGLDVRLLQRSDIGSPSIWCWSTPAIILMPPRLSSHLSVDCLASVFSHELAHLTRRDHIKSLLANALLSVIGWNPLAWYVRARLGQLAERACDAAASTSDRASADYAEALLRLAVGRPPRLGLAIARYGGLSLRIRRILDGQDSRLTISRRFVAFLGAGILVSSTVLAPVQRTPGVEYQFPDGLRVRPIALQGGTFFIRTTDEDLPEGHDPADPDTSEPPRWTTKD
jgi:beta-lactamase regulating signal transducer with metallopeptidase domain